MSVFEFAFSLFGLILGLSVAEIVGGLARVLRYRGRVRLGWLTPGLGLVLFVDLVSFWNNAWAVREAIPPGYVSLLIGATIAAVYFLSAALVFPSELDQWPDLDDYFMRHKGQVMAGVIAANLAMRALRFLWLGSEANAVTIATDIAFTSVAVALVLARRKWLAGALLGIILCCYAIFSIMLGAAG